MPSVLLRYLLFVSSYFPLALIFFFLFIEQQPIWAVIVLAIGMLGLTIMLVFFLRLAPRLAPIQEKVTGLQGRDGEAMGYIASYLIPFVDIKKVIEKNHLPVQTVLVHGKEKLLYDPADKWVLLKLLDDNYLWSLMTDMGYEVTGKRELSGDV